MKVSDYIVSLLADRGVNTVFGYIGGMITHLVDSLGQSQQVRYVQTLHEQTAAIAAEGYALESGKFGVAICTSGPGVTNLITGIADAYFGSIPVLFISGQVNTYEYKYDKPVRQQGFQEMDVVSVVSPITKYSVLLDDADKVKYEFEKAIHIATHGRKGPVMIDLPMDISRAEIDVSGQRGYVPEEETLLDLDMESFRSLVESAERPMFLVGGGCQGAGVKAELDALLRQTGIPVVTSLMGRGLIDETFPHYIGMIGSYGNRSANMAVARADLLIALGSRLDTRQTGAMYQSFLRNGTVIHVDIDENELDGNRLENRVKVHADVAQFVRAMKEAHFQYRDYTEWNGWIKTIKQHFGQEAEIERFVDNKAPYRILQDLNKITRKDDIVTADIGQNQMWAAQTLQMKKGMKFVTSGGLAPMGFSLPVAIGMAFARPDKRVFCLTGDGGLNMALQSLGVIAQYGLNIKVIVLNNAALGMITQFQHLYFQDRMFGTTAEGGYINPDFAALATAFGLPYIETSGGLPDHWENADKPVLVNCLIEGRTTVSPKLEYNSPIDKPSPQLDAGEFDRFMGTRCPNS